MLRHILNVRSRYAEKTEATLPVVKTPELNVPKELVNGPMAQGDLKSMIRSLKKDVIERAMSA